MSVNDIDFTLGSYDPNKAAGLLVMAQENDRKISDSLKGILDGFEKTARSNADVQAMNYINSLGLQDMTPDKMPKHTQALEQIAGNMGGLNPSKEALTALEGRGNVLTQRAINDVSLATNQHNWNITKEKYDFETALPVLADTYQSMQSFNRDISELDNAIRNFAGDTSSEEYTALTNKRDQLIADYSRTYTDYTNKAGTLSPFYSNNLPHHINVFTQNRATEGQEATNKLNKSKDTASSRAVELYAPVAYQAISSRFQTSVGEGGKVTTIDTTTGKPVTGDEINSTISSMLDTFGLFGDTRTMTMNRVTELQKKAETEAFERMIKQEGIAAKRYATDAAVSMNAEKIAAQILMNEKEIAAEKELAKQKLANEGSGKTSLTNPNGQLNKEFQDKGIHTWVTGNGQINTTQMQADVSQFVSDTGSKLSRGYYDTTKGDFVVGGVTNWFTTQEGKDALNSMEGSGYVAKGKSAQVLTNYFNTAPDDIKELLPTTAHKVEFIKILAASQHKDQTSMLNKFFLTLPRGTNGTMPLNLILGLDADGKFSDTGRAKGNDAIVKKVAVEASNAVKNIKNEYIRSNLQPKFKAIANLAALNGGFLSESDVINTYGLGSISDVSSAFNIDKSAKSKK